MTDEEILLTIIKQQGCCVNTPSCDCCPLLGSGCGNRRIAYKVAIKKYLTLYGKENLVEALI